MEAEKWRKGQFEMDVEIGKTTEIISSWEYFDQNLVIN